VAHVITKSADEGSAYSYEHLAAIWNAHLNGNSAATIALQQMPAGEARLAKMLHESFVPKGKKSKKKAKTITKAARNVDSRRMRLEMLMGHPDAWVRETARSALEKM
jgi:hypothetical protein